MESKSMMLTSGELSEHISAATGSGLNVVSASRNRFSVHGESVAQWLFGKTRISFDAIIKLDEASSTVTYWEMLTERSSGITAGFFMSRYSQKGVARSESESGTMPSGESYSYDFGSYRELIRKLAADAGWQFNTVLMKPKD